MNIRIEVERERRLVIVTVCGDVPAGKVGHMVSAAMADDPLICGFDFFFDASAYLGGADNTDLARIATAYVPQPDLGRLPRTAFWIADPYFHLWTPVMDGYLSDRRHRAFARREDALAYLAAGSE